MKKIMGCTAGEWALKLYTVDRFISLEYLLDEQEGEYGICGVSKRVHSYEYLRNEKIDDLIVIINDTRKYEEIKNGLYCGSICILSVPDAYDRMDMCAYDRTGLWTVSEVHSVDRIDPASVYRRKHDQRICAE